MTNLRDQFMLDADYVFLNHGSFGATPKPVFAAYQQWQLQLERQPVAFFMRHYDAALDQARARLAAYVNAPLADLFLVQNATAGLNAVVRSLDLQPDDEILTTDHEYGALNNLWAYVCRRSGAKYVQQTLPLPFTDANAIVDALWQGVTPKTRVIFLSHITSATALIMPLQQICQRAREAGIMTIVDGAHAPGQMDLDLQALGADVYSGNCHKWLCAPKGSAFVTVRPDYQDQVVPLVVGWGWDAEAFTRRHHWQGTRDAAAMLAVPDAIDFLQAHDWGSVRARCHQLASETRARISALTGLAPLSDDAPQWFGQMVALPLPAGTDGKALQERLYQDYKIEVPATHHNGQAHLRVSFQGYNSQADADALLNALQDLL